MLNWSQAELAEAANLTRQTVASFEGAQRTPGVNNLAAIRQALEEAGIDFIERNGGGPGVRLREG